MAIEKVFLLFGDRELANEWDHCRRTMRQAGGLNFMLGFRSELEAGGNSYAVVKEERPFIATFRNTLILRWDLQPTPGRWRSRGIKLELEADDEGRVSVSHSTAFGWENLMYDPHYGEMSLEKKARLAMTLAGYQADRFYGNPVNNVLQRMIGFFEARKVA